MSAGNFTLYSSAVQSIGAGVFSFGTDTYKVILLTTGYTPNVQTDATYGAISANEVASGNGYTQGGIPLTGQTFTQNGNTSVFAAQSAVWTGANFAARYVAVVRQSGATLAPTDRLLGYGDLTGGGNANPTNSVMQVNWNNSSTPSSPGTLFTLTHAP